MRWTRAILDGDTAVTGRPYLPPRWAFRHLRRRDEHRAGTTVALDGVPMNADFAELETAARGWFWDSSGPVPWLELSSGAHHTAVEITYR